VAKPAKPKMVRDSFTMPQADFDLVHLLKERALGFRRPTKKSELLRAGLQALGAPGRQGAAGGARRAAGAQGREAEEGRLSHV
jgi:hypothetical protein